ncbi:MAG TPA: hypothetical protein DCZ95_19655 [Verrucomicrobia bacterium]|nr:hypothetical protein [Verrucomicrobiota bacterium]
MSRLGILFSIVGIALIVWAIMERGSVWSSRKWPTTSGKIIFSDIQETDLLEEHTYAVEYVYAVGAKNYSNDTVSLQKRTDPSYLRQRYPKGSSVTVHYDPNDPHRALLETGFPWDNVTINGIGVVMILLGVSMLMNKDEWD